MYELKKDYCVILDVLAGADCSLVGLEIANSKVISMTFKLIDLGYYLDSKPLEDLREQITLGGFGSLSSVEEERSDA